jgi:hypothetical protein
MSAKVVVDLILNFVDQHIIPGSMDPASLQISFRTDNGSQFIAKAYKRLMKRFNFNAVYIPPATPQLNGHIESFHASVQKLICDKYEFQSIEEAILVFERFYQTYNNKRILTCLLDNTPKNFIKLWKDGMIEQKEQKGKLIFFFKEESETTHKKFVNKSDGTVSSNTSPGDETLPPFEVNLNIQDFSNIQNKDIVNLPQQIYAI